MIWGSLIFEGNCFWKIEKKMTPIHPSLSARPLKGDFAFLPIEIWSLSPHTPWIESLWPIEAEVTPCPCQVQASRDRVHFHSLSWNLSSGISKSLGCLLDDTSQHRVTRAKAFPDQSAPSQGPRHRPEAGQYQTSPASISRAAQMCRRLGEIMKTWYVKALHFGVFGFTVSIYKILNQASAKFLRNARPPRCRNKINPSYIMIRQSLLGIYKCLQLKMGQAVCTGLCHINNTNPSPFATRSIFFFFSVKSSDVI